MRYHKRYLSISVLAVLLLVTAGAGPPACSSKDQPRTVADILIAAENAKRSLRATNRTDPATGITAQQDYDISFRLLAANRAYKSFINDELARLAADPSAQPNPDARKQAIAALVGSLKGLDDPTALGIKNEQSKALWRIAVTGLSTVIAGLEVLGGDK